MDKIQYMHYRSTNGTHGGATVAILPLENNKVFISIAYCNPADTFNKKLGRAISAGRLQAALNGRNNLSNYIREIDVADMNYLKDSVAEELGMEMAAACLA